MERENEMTDDDSDSSHKERPMLDLWVKFQNKMVADEGASLVEYALLLVLIAVVAIVVITQVGENTSGTFSKVNESLK
jgi:Flp pilus assembly pilin Flp